METDLDDTYTDSTGFPLTMANEITFMTEMAGAVHGLGLAWFLKNDINGDSLISRHGAPGRRDGERAVLAVRRVLRPGTVCTGGQARAQRRVRR